MNFQEFIIEHNSVDSDFIRDFNHIINEDYIENYNKKIVNSKILQQWCAVDLSYKFNTLIKKSCVKDIDYELENVANSETLMLTTEAAIKICMIIKSKKGLQLIQCFMDLKIALYKYKDYIINGMKTKIKLLTINQLSKIYYNN